MFEGSLVESSGRLRQKNPWTTAVSFTIQSMVGAGVVMLSLLYTDTLPIHRLISTLEAPPPPAQAPPPTLAVKLARQPGEFNQGVLTVPREIPNSIARIRDEQPATELKPEGSTGVTGGISNGTGNSMISEVLRDTPKSVPRVEVQKVRVSSGVAQGLLVHQVKPQYPPLARQARIQGVVVLQAVIGKDGTVEDLRVISGHPMLTAAAIEAVKQWRYRPYYLNNEPVAVDTQINVNFTLGTE
jgi:periplasmic protein TonB